MNIRPFELALVTGFGLLALLALGLLATYRPASDETKVTLGASVEIWGTLDDAAFYRVMQPIIEANEAYKVILYTEKDEDTFTDELVNALAEDRGPDIVLLPHEQLTSYRSKLQAIPEANFPIRDFKNLYIDGAEIFVMSDGLYAYPIAVDPLVLYWNRDIFATKNLLTAPKTWEELVNNTVPTLVERDFNRNITRSALAFGEHRNVTHASDIISLLTIQSGSSLVTENTNDNSYRILLNESTDRSRLPLETALTFYTSFANPNSALYTWNRAKAIDRDAFLAEDLVMYIGRGSEARSLAAQNPNLNFDLAEVPQGAGATIKRTYGTFYGLALLKSSNNKSGAFLAMQLLGRSDVAKGLAEAWQMAPLHRSTLATGSTDVYGRIVYGSAIYARGWWSPEPDEVDTIFGQMVEDVLANRRKTSESASDAVGRLSQVY